MSFVLIELQRIVEENRDEEKMVNGEVHQVHEEIREPCPVSTKGRPPQVKSSQQNSSKKSIKLWICRVCKLLGHEYRNCKVHKHTADEQSSDESVDDFDFSTDMVGLLLRLFVCLSVCCCCFLFIYFLSSCQIFDAINKFTTTSCYQKKKYYLVIFFISFLQSLLNN